MEGIDWRRAGRLARVYDMIPTDPHTKLQTTLGPRGRNVVLMRDVGYPEVINDGVTIARDINLPGAHSSVLCLCAWG